MPENFRYKEALLKGPPQHEPYDDFRIKHPPMPLSKRAKIFSPFAALRGFDREIVAKQVEYEEQRPMHVTALRTEKIPLGTHLIDLQYSLWCHSKTYGYLALYESIDRT